MLVSVRVECKRFPAGRHRGKEGYEPVVIDIKPKPLPERRRDVKIPLTVKVEMQPVKSPSR